MNVTDILDKLPGELAARLESDPFFADIPIVLAVKGDTAAEIQKREAAISKKSGKRGVAVIVLQVVGDDIYEGHPGGPMRLYPSFLVIEHVEMNNDSFGTKKSARKVGRHIIKNLKIAGFRGIVQAMKCSKPAIQPMPISDSPKLVGEQVNFECQEFSDEKFFYCLPPLLAKIDNEARVVLTCNTPGVEIWFTLDDSFPYPGDADKFPKSTAQKYADPIDIELDTPTVIRAMAHLDGYIDSSIERFTVTITNATINQG